MKPESNGLTKKQAYVKSTMEKGMANWNSLTKGSFFLGRLLQEKKMKRWRYQISIQKYHQYQWRTMDIQYISLGLQTELPPIVQHRMNKELFQKWKHGWDRDISSFPVTWLVLKQNVRHDLHWLSIVFHH